MPWSQEERFNKLNNKNCAEGIRVKASKLGLLALLLVLLIGTPAWSSGRGHRPVKARAGKGHSGGSSANSGKGMSPAKPAGREERGSDRTQRTVPPPDPADEARSYTLTPMGSVGPVGQYNGDVRDLPQVPARELHEPELVEPQDYIHNTNPIWLPPGSVAEPAAPMPPLITSFPGMSFADNCQGGQCGNGHPPDTTGAVGSHHYIQAINSSFAIYDKSTGIRLAAFTEASLWSGATNNACTTSPEGDPIVVYDQVFDRWIITDFAFTSDTFGPYYECFAVSKSSDPVSGGWWLYAVQTDQGQVPANTLDDYPKMGVWNDGCLYMGANGFNNSTYNGQIIFGINRTQMYSGSNASFTLGFLPGTANFSLFPAAMLGNGVNLPSPTTPAYFVQESLTGDAFNVRTVSADACDTGGTIGSVVAVPHQTYNSFGQNIVPQPPPGNNNPLDSLGFRMMQWVQYRKIGSAESLWVNHTTYIAGQNTSPQWGQINVTGGTIHTNIVQQQIYQRDTSLYRWMGSLAVDNVGNMALCYSTSNGLAPNYPSIQCSGRLSTDPPNQLPQGETKYVTGQGSQLQYQRWGDYSSTTVDPVDDCTFWHTNMFYNGQTNGNSANFQTQIFAFKFPNCAGGQQYALDVSVSGSGTVTSTDGFINCPGVCSHNYGPGTHVTLDASPAQGWGFIGWSGDCTGSGSCQLVMDGDKSASASFEPASFVQLASFPNPSTAGQQVTITATVGPSGPPAPTGTVSFTSNGVAISGCSNVPLVSQLAHCVTSSLAVGTDTIVATYSGDSNYLGSSGMFSQIVNPVPTPVQFVAITPCRLVDTRHANGTFGGPILSGNTTRNFPLSQTGNPCGIPANAVAYSLNVAVVPSGRLNFLTMWPAGQGQPVVATLNSLDGRTKSNAAIVSAGTPSGAVSVYVTNTTHVILDINGYFTSGNDSTLEFYPLTPCRVVDTRHPVGPLGGPHLGNMEVRDLPFPASSCLNGVVNPKAYSINIAVVPNPSGTRLNYLTVWPSDKPLPGVANLNNPTATVVSNAAIVPAAPNGHIKVFAYNSTDVIMDINGYFAAPGQNGLSFYSVTPCRVYDSRSNHGQPFHGTRVIDIAGSQCAPPAGAGAYVFNAAVVPSGRMPYLTLWPDGEGQPVVATLNAYDGYVTSNMAIVPNDTGAIDAYADGLTHLILDIAGYFAP